MSSPDDAGDAPRLDSPDQLRHELLSALTIVSAQTQLLERQLARMDGFSDGDRQRLVSGLEVILSAARALNATFAFWLAIREDGEGT